MPFCRIEDLPAMFAGDGQAAPRRFFVCGEEPALALEAADAVRERARGLGYSDRLGFMVEDARFDWSAPRDAASMGSLFDERRLIEIDCSRVELGATIEKKLLDLLRPSPVDYFLLARLGKVDARRKNEAFCAEAAKTAGVLETPTVGPDRLAPWLSARLKAAGLGIEAGAVDLFSERVEGNLMAARQEVEKLSLLFSPGHVLSQSDVERTVGSSAAYDMFDFARAWMEGDVARVNRFVDGFVKADSPLPLHNGILFADVNRLLRLFDALDRRESVASALRKAKIWGSKREIAPRAAMRIGGAGLLRAAQRCAEIDMAAKGALKADPWQLFRETAMELALGR